MPPAHCSRLHPSRLHGNLGELLHEGGSSLPLSLSSSRHVVMGRQPWVSLIIHRNNHACEISLMSFQPSRTTSDLLFLPLEGKPLEFLAQLRIFVFFVHLDLMQVCDLTFNLWSRTAGSLPRPYWASTPLPIRALLGIDTALSWPTRERQLDQAQGVPCLERGMPALQGSEMDREPAPHPSILGQGHLIPILPSTPERSLESAPSSEPMLPSHHRICLCLLQRGNRGSTQPSSNPSGPLR